MRSNFELFDDQFTDGSLISLHSRFLDRTLFTIGTFPRPHAFVIRSTPVPPEGEFHLLAYSQIFSDLSVLFVTARHFQNVLQTLPRARRERPSNSPS